MSSVPAPIGVGAGRRQGLLPDNRRSIFGPGVGPQRRPFGIRACKPLLPAWTCRGPGRSESCAPSPAQPRRLAWPKQGRRRKHGRPPKTFDRHFLIWNAEQDIGGRHRTVRLNSSVFSVTHELSSRHAFRGWMGASFTPECKRARRHTRSEQLARKRRRILWDRLNSRVRLR